MSRISASALPQQPDLTPGSNPRSHVNSRAPSSLRAQRFGSMTCCANVNTRMLPTVSMQSAKPLPKAMLFKPFSQLRCTSHPFRHNKPLESSRRGSRVVAAAQAGRLLCCVLHKQAEPLPMQSITLLLASGRRRVAAMGQKRKASGADSQ